MKGHIVVCAIVLSLSSPASAEQHTPPNVTTTFLHSWVPELGSLQPHDEFERSLGRAVDEALRGRYATAEAMLNDLATKAKTERQHILILLARQQVVHRRYELTTGGRLSEGETALDERRNGEDGIIDTAFALAEGMPPEERDDAKFAIKFAAMLQLITDQIPSDERDIAANPIDMPREQRAQLTSTFDDLLAMFGQLEDMASASDVLSVADADLLRHLTSAEMARSRGNDSEARSHLNAALATATARGKPYWLIRLGDAHLSPRTSPWLLGIDTIAAENFISTVRHGDYPKQLDAPSADDIAKAVTFYDSAEASGIDTVLPAIELRRAYIHLVRGDIAGAAKAYDAVVRAGVHRSDLVTWSAAAAYGILRTDRFAVTAAITAASAENNGGFVLSVALAARVWTSMLRHISARIDRAVVLLEIISDALVKQNRRAGVEPLLDLIDLYDDNERYAGAIVAARQAEILQRDFICEWERDRPPLDPDVVFTPDDEEELLTTVMGKLESAMRTKSLLESDAALAAEADLLAQEYARRMYIYSAESVRPIPEVQQNAMRLPILSRLSSEASALTGRPCKEIVPAIASIRRRAKEANLTTWRWQFDLNNFACVQENLEEDARQIRQQGGVVRRVEEQLATIARLDADTSHSVDATLARANLAFIIDEAFTGIRILSAASGDGEDVVRETKRLGELISRTPSLQSYTLEMMYLAAFLHYASNKPAETVSACESIVESHDWIDKSIPFKVQTLTLQLDAEAELCQDRNSCRPDRALLALERLYFERRRWQWLQSGTSREARATGEQAALESRLAASPLLGPDEFQQLTKLREKGEAALLSDSPPTLDKVKQTIAAVPSDVTVLTYAMEGTKAALWRSREGVIELIPLSETSDEIVARAVRLQNELASPLVGSWKALAAELYDLLIRPAGDVPSNDTIVVIASGELGHLPFDVLGPVDGPRLFQLHPIIYTDHVGAPQPLPPSSGSRAAVIGVNAAGLVAAEEEARDIATLLSTKPLLGSAAKATAVIETVRTARWVHLATHATLVADNPFDSYLTLAGGEQLRAWEIFRDAPAAELIVLSACDSRAEAQALHDTGAVGRPVTSLTSFAFAGDARYVIASLWRATDRATIETMEHFYRSLSRDGDIARALQKAKIAASNGGMVHPYYFANFVLTARDLGAVSETTPRK